jgi:hypothetical protein
MKTYSVEEVAAMFGGGPGWWLRNGVREGRFPHLKIGRSTRFTDDHVKAITAELEHKPRPQEKPSADVAVFGATARSAKLHRNRAS